MTSIRIPPDDLGLRDLQVDNTRPSGSPSVTPVNPTRPVEKTREFQPTQLNPLEVQRVERRQGERRQVERRQQDERVLLDTRTYHDRRTQAGNRESDQESETHTATRRGIDKTV